MKGGNLDKFRVSGFPYSLLFRYFPDCRQIKWKNMDDWAVRLCCYFYLFAPISMFLNLPNTGRCLYSHLVPDGTFKFILSILIPSKASSINISTLLFYLTVEWMALKDVQPEKASSLMLITLLGNLTLLTFLSFTPLRTVPVISNKKISSFIVELINVATNICNYL